MDKRNKQILINSRNGFYSLCRNINSFDCDNEILNKYVNKLTELYEIDNKGIYYLLYLDFLKNKIVNRSITPEEAATILLNVLDSDFELYKIFEDNCNILNIKDESMKRFHFFDKKLLELEKKYIKLNNLEDEYSFAKRKELK